MKHRQIIVKKQADVFSILLNKWRTDNDTNLKIQSSLTSTQLSITPSKMIKNVKAQIYHNLYHCNHPIDDKN